MFHVDRNSPDPPASRPLPPFAIAAQRRCRPAILAVVLTAAAACSPIITYRDVPPAGDETLLLRINGEAAHDGILMRSLTAVAVSVEGPIPAPVYWQHEDGLYVLESHSLLWSGPGQIESPTAAETAWRLPEAGGDYALEARLIRQYHPARTPDFPASLFNRERTHLRIEQIVRVTAVVPFSSELMVDGAIDGYAIGKYRDPSARGVPAVVATYRDKYAAPAYYYRVTEDNQHLSISKYFVLGDFDLNFDYMFNGFPQYIALDMRLVRKLDDVIDRLREQGYPVTRFSLISGYRSPAYNYGSMGDGADLKASFSRHMYGDAADFIVDEDGDGVFDDLNGDGKVNCEDARIVFLAGREIDREYYKRGVDALGGRGLYSRHDALERKIQTPYVHIDTRGYAHADGSPIEWFEGCAPR